MKADSALFTVEQIRKLENRIDPKPQYQRTPVWKIDRKKLLIDSIFRGYELPKFYLHRLSNNLLFDYEICDGQQRLRTIWEFLKDGFLTQEGTICDGADISRKLYSELNETQKQFFLNHVLTVSVITVATRDEIRELFARLQKGVGLNQAELRRALSSHIGTFVESLVDNHAFFRQCGIVDLRNKLQDLTDHAVAYLVDGVNKDFKGINLRDVYLNISPQEASNLAQKVTNILDDLQKINDCKTGVFKNKWGFLDGFMLIHEMKILNKRPVYRELATMLEDFEIRRKRVNRKDLETLLNAGPKEQRLYFYIRSFDKDGALKENVRKRRDIFVQEFADAFKLNKE